MSFTEMEKMGEGNFQTFREKKMNEMKISDVYVTCYVCVA